MPEHWQYGRLKTTEPLIYDKSEQSNISDKDLKELLKHI